MATSRINTMKNTGDRVERPRIVARGLMFIALIVVSGTGPVFAQGETPEFTVIKVDPTVQSANDLVAGWDQPRKPPQLTGNERQELIEAVSGGGSGGIPLINNIQTQGRTPTVRQLILSVKRPWYVHRAFLSSEGAQRVDARSVMHFDESTPGRAVVGLNLVAGKNYLVDFLVDGNGEGTYTIESGAGTQEFPDPEGERNHVLLALQAQQSGWAELSLRRSAGSFDLHSVEVTLAVGSEEGAQQPGK